LRLGFRTNLSLTEALELAALAIYEAGDNDPSTGGPDFVRNLYPMMVTITARGFEELESSYVGATFRTIMERRTQTGGVAGGTLR
jgi:proteasome beta subunit